MSGSDIRKALVNSASSMSADLNPDFNPEIFFQTDSVAGCHETLKFLIAEASVAITSALVVAEESGAQTITENPHLAKLIAMRTSSGAYTGETPMLAPFLGLEFARTIIPDEVLQKLSIDDILHFRKETAEAYNVWKAEISRIAATFDELDPLKAQENIPHIITTKLAPKIVECQREMKDIRDRLFGNIIKTVLQLDAPILSIAYITSHDITTSIAAFSMKLLQNAGPKIVDYITERRCIQRRHAMSYLLRISP